MLDALNFSGPRRLPLIRAAEAAECGLACVAMIGQYYGHAIDLNGLRRRYPLSMAGATLRTLIGLADQLQLSTRAVRVDLSGMKNLRLPAILHWDLNHFVVLKSIGRHGAVIHDPGAGARRLSLEEVSKHFTGVALELYPTADFASIAAEDKLSIRSLWSQSSGLVSAALQLLIISAALQLATFAIPFQIQLVVDEAVGHADGALLNIIALAFGGLAIIQCILGGLRDWTVQVVGNLLTFQVVGNLFRHLLRLPTEYFEKRHVGDIMSRLNSTSTIQDTLTKGALSAIIDGFMAVFAGLLLLAYSPAMTLVVVAALVLSFLISLVIYPAMHGRTEDQIVASAFERSYLMESVRAATTIKVMGREVEREGVWRNLYSKVINANVRFGRLQLSAHWLNAAIAGLSTTAVIYLGARSVIAGSGMSIGMLLAFLSFKQTFSDRVTSLITQYSQFRLLSLHMDRIGDIATAKPDTPEGPIPKLDFAGGLRLKQVSFRYGEADRWILKDFDIDIAPGEFVAIVGPSGRGKTTLLKLLLGLREPVEGSAIIDGQVATPELWRAWRSHVGVVAQDDRLLSGSIADNIAFFDPDLDMSRVVEAARLAQVAEDIERMPMRYESLIGDMGSSLSGGQRQRVLLARALYRQPKVLILDEGTANIDPASETLIAELVSTMPITRIAVAHRSALIAKADRIIEL